MPENTPPYGADLPREPMFSRRGSRMQAALDAANAEVLALREVVEAVRRQSRVLRDAKPAPGWDERYLDGWNAAMGSLIRYLPAPTEEG